LYSVFQPLLCRKFIIVAAARTVGSKIDEANSGVFQCPAAASDDIVRVVPGSDPPELHLSQGLLRLRQANAGRRSQWIQLYMSAGRGFI
jgi:hypothetical protein